MASRSTTPSEIRCPYCHEWVRPEWALFGFTDERPGRCLAYAVAVCTCGTGLHHWLGAPVLMCGELADRLN